MYHSGDGANSVAASKTKIGIARCCASVGCTNQPIIGLASKEFCLDHFLVRCYERLDSLEPIARNHRLGAQEAAKARTQVQECANQTLLVCLSQRPLNNLERSRLLEILLQCGDLQVLLRRPALQLT